MPLRTSAARGLAVALAALAAAPAFCEPEKKPEKPAKTAAEEKAEKAKQRAEAYDDATRGARTTSGFFRFRKKDGTLYADLGSGELNRPFLLFAQVARGAADEDILGGTMLSMEDEWVLEFKRVDEKVHLIRKNIRYRADDKTPLAGAVALSYSDTLLTTFEIAGEKGGRVLVDLGDYFLGDFLGLGSRLWVRGSLRGGLSRWSAVKSFPRNSELEAEMVWSVPGGTYSPSRQVSFTLHYSLVAMPEAGFKPRPADDRVGYFMTAIKDYSAPGRERHFKRFVNRWRLEKADPKAARSPAKRPVIFYIENTVPFRWRPYIRAGILEWNKAFEAAGILDALEVRVQADGAAWDPEDVRYNTIRWITSPWTFAIGPSHADPRTGEILDADILIDNSWIDVWSSEVELFDLKPLTAGRSAWVREQAARRLARRDAGGRAAASPSPGRKQGAAARGGPGLRRHAGAGHPGASPCDHRAFAAGFAHQFSLGALHLAAAEGVAERAAGGKKDPEKKDEGDGDGEKKKPAKPALPEWFIGSALKDLVMHEVGHTLGLRHNFRASAFRDQDGLHDAATTAREGLSGSVMDYLPVNLAAPGAKQGQYHPSTIGPYDRWAIRYGYGPGGADELKKLAARGAEPGHDFASDEDAWIGLDPLADTWDLGKDPLAHARVRLAHVKRLWKEVLPRVVREGEGFQRARSAVRTLLFEVFMTGTTGARFIGGQYHHRDHKGDPDARPPFEYVPAARQREALKVIAEGVFSDETFRLPPELLTHLAPRHWWHWGESPDFPLHFGYHEWVQILQEITLIFLLDPAVLERLADADRGLPPDADRFTVGELTRTLSEIVFRELEVAPGSATWTETAPYISSTRRNLQRSYVGMLMTLLEWIPLGWWADSAAAARAELTAVRAKLKTRIGDAGAGLDALSRAHLADLEVRVGALLEARRVVDR